MRSLLDMAIEATVAGGPRIVSAVHDVSKINVDVPDFDKMQADRVASAEAALARVTGGGGWDAAEMGMSREMALTRLADAKTPIDREAVIADLTQRAIRRAGLDTSNGRVNVMVAGQPAWHGLGVNVAAAVGSADAIKLAGLDWQVGKIPMSYRHPATGEMVATNDINAIVRLDTGAYLGNVGSKYTPFQNAEGFAFLDDVLTRFGARYESAGSIYGGAKVWMLVNLPEQRFRVTANDEIEPYAIFTNAHDGTGAARCFPTSQRVVCANTFRLAQSERDKGLAFRHTGNLKAKVEDAKEILGLAVREFREFKDAADQLVHAPVDADRYFSDLLDTVCGITAAEAAQGVDALVRAMQITEEERAVEAKRLTRELDKRTATLDDILTRYESERCGVDGIRGSTWAAFNAVTESADHGALAGRFVGDDHKRASARFESVIVGRADEVKQTAYQLAMARFKN